MRLYYIPIGLCLFLYWNVSFCSSLCLVPVVMPVMKDACDKHDVELEVPESYIKLIDMFGFIPAVLFTFVLLCFQVALNWFNWYFLFVCFLLFPSVNLEMYTSYI